MKKVHKKISKKCAAALLAAAMLLVTGCGQAEKTIEGSVENIQPVDITSATESGQTENGDSKPDTDRGGAAGPDQGPETAGGAASDGYLFTADGVSIAMDADAAPILERLGEPVSYFEAASCAFEGLDKMYTYQGFEVDTYPTGEKDYISTVILKDDSVATGEGIAIGDSLEKLQQAYPEGKLQENGMIVCEKGGMKLCFILENDEVKSIEYRSMALE